jgi:glyoxylase-like metal-dependent hydrolase (beta-lactamase superfamily II)
MRTWLIVIVALLASLGVLFYWALIDGDAPANAEGEFDLAAYRALVAEDALETLPTAVRIEFTGASTAPGFAAEAGAFGAGERNFAYGGAQIIAPGGNVIIDAGLDADTLTTMTDGDGAFDAAAYQRQLTAIPNAAHVLITHEHLDHVMAIARHPDPDTIAPRLRLTAAQLAGLPQHAPGGVLAPAIATIAPIDLSAPQRIAPGVVAVAAPGHSLGAIVIYVKTTAREYLFIGDIAWVMSSIQHLHGRPRAINLFLPGVDPDRPAVLRQLRALHDMAATEPDLVIVPAHDADYLHGLVESGVLEAQFTVAAPEAAPVP